MIRKAIRHLLVPGVLFVIPALLRGGANTWTGSSPSGPGQILSLVASSSADPDVVFGTLGGLLHRSGDGGRTWRRVGSFSQVGALLVHPASPSTIYASGYDPSAFLFAVFKSEDSGDTWSRVLDGTLASVLAGSPNDESTVFAGTWNVVYKTTNGGAYWSHSDVVGLISTLVIDTHEPETAYAGGESSYYYGWATYPGAFSKTTDGGAHWEDVTPNPDSSLVNVTAVALDSVSSSTVYIATDITYGWAGGATGIQQLLRSEDGGVSWTPASSGLPEATARRLAVDPRVAGTLYAATRSGIYRSRDGGRSWTPFSQQLNGTEVSSLWIADDGRVLHAGTPEGVFHLEIAEGPLDVAAGPDNGSRILSRSADQASLGTLDASGRFANAPPEDSSPTWTATAIATAPGSDRTHVLWQNGDGRSALEIVGPSGREAVKVFTADPGWIASDLSVRADGRTSVLWTSAGGAMRVATVDAVGASNVGPQYGPAIGWSAVAIADGADGQARVLWRATDGRSALSFHRDGAMLVSSVWPADPGWAVEDIAVGADGRVRLLRTAPDGTAEVSTVESGGHRTSAESYASPGFTPRRIAAGSDGLTRLLFGDVRGGGDLVILTADNTLSARRAIPAASSATIVVTSSAELSAALAPANAGAQILVRAGEYEVNDPLTVPDRAILAGEGVMTLDASKLPAGIAASGRTTLRAAADLAGDVLTLGDGSVLQSLVIEDAGGRAAGNPVAVVSRDAGDRVSARILDCEIVNPNASGIAPQGPTGRGLVAWTRNPNLNQDPPPHEGAHLRVQMTRSIVRSPAAGIGVFTINFASHARIDLDLDSSVIGGGLTAAGGVSRPDAVSDAGVSVASRRNLYRSDSDDPTPVGWNLQGGTTAPIPTLASEASTSNALRVLSQDDRIEGFLTGIFATGATRSNALSEPSSSNEIDLNLQGMRLQTAAADLTLFGATTFVDGVSAGDGNSVHLVLRQSKGSGPRANVYAHSAGDLGTGNRLEIAGSATAFDRTNDDIDPAPPAEFFEAGE